MTLADLLPQLPLSAEYGRQYALVFSASLRDRLIEVQQQYGRQTFTVFPAGPLIDGRYYHCADILSEVGPGGIYGAGFAHLDASRFDEIEVVPLADAVALLPPDPLQG
jgi:hypothetical protein